VKMAICDRCGAQFKRKKVSTKLCDECWNKIKQETNEKRRHNIYESIWLRYKQGRL